MTHRVDLADVGEHPVDGIHQQIQHPFQRGLVIREGGFHLVGRRARLLVGDGAAGADAFTVALGQHMARVHIKQLIFQGRAAGVDHQNFHGSTLHYLYSNFSNRP